AAVQRLPEFLLPLGVGLVPVVAAGIPAQHGVPRHIPGDLGVIGPGAVDHDPGGADSPPHRIAVVMGQDLFSEPHSVSPAVSAWSLPSWEAFSASSLALCHSSSLICWFVTTSSNSFLLPRLKASRSISSFLP